VSAALLDRPLPSPAPDAREHRRPRARRGTLEQRLEGAWARLAADGVTECPVCRASMRLDDGAARCGGCGSILS
jgi:hypothetical protein